MPFIGNQPALSYTSFAKQDFTTSATTSYTLSQPVTNENEIALFINFVRQEPTTAYTASGTSLTLTSATSASDDMYAIFLGKAVQTVNPPAGSVGLSQLSATGTKDSTTFLRGDNTFATVVSGLTEADNWRITADISNPGGFITTNWERSDSTGSGYLGTGMTESSGVFSFPSTGYYLVNAFGLIKFTSGAHDGADFSIYATTDNSTYSRTMLSQSSSLTTNYYQATAGCMIFDVTNISTHKIKFNCFAPGSLAGSTSENRTHVLFIKLGAT